MLRTLIELPKCCVQQQIRQYARGHRYRPNAGISRQLNEGTNDTEYDDDDLSKYEADLTNAGDIYDQYRRESVENKETIRRNVVRNKYFNGKKLAFLTWAEMEQIRVLNGNDPEEWNVHRLAESFPASVETIQKVLNAKWQPRDARRVAKHDEKVVSNWKAFTNGELNELGQAFSEHLRKFSARNLNPTVDYSNVVVQTQLPKPKGSEFLKIITSCKKYKEEPKQITSEDEGMAPAKQLLSKNLPTPKNFSSRKLYAFKAEDSVNEITSNGRPGQDIFNNPDGIGIKGRQNEPQGEPSSTSTVRKFENNEVQLQENDLKQLSMPSIRERITIPEKWFKEGATYRLNDCYYDDDGEFLYRVPGMTKV